MKKIKILVVIFFILLININFVYAFEVEEETNYIWLQEEINQVSSKAIKELNLNSRYAVVFDRDSKTILYGKNENKQVPMASTTKIMSAIVLLEQLEKMGLTLDSQIEVCKEAASIGGSRLGLKTGDIISINDLLYGLMLCSRK